MRFSLNATTASTTHLIWCDGRWVEAVAMEVNGEDGFRFRDVADAVAWLRA